MNHLRTFALSAGVAASGLFLNIAAQASDLTDSLKTGKAAIQSAGALAFGPEGVLFVGDSRGGSVWAIATGDSAKASSMESVDVQNLGKKVADKLGVPSSDLLINDLAVNPTSGTAYLSISRGKGPDAQPVIFQISKGEVKEVDLENIAHSKVDLPALPAASAVQRGQSLRNDAITDLAFMDGKLYVAGLSNFRPVSLRSTCLSRPLDKVHQSRSITVLTANMKPSRQSGPLSHTESPVNRTYWPLTPARLW